MAVEFTEVESRKDSDRLRRVEPFAAATIVYLLVDGASLGGYAQPCERSLIGLSSLRQVLVGLKTWTTLLRTNAIPSGMANDPNGERKLHPKIKISLSVDHPDLDPPSVTAISCHLTTASSPHLSSSGKEAHP